MRIRELQSREDFELILVQTLARGWSEQYGRTHVDMDVSKVGQRWNVNSLFSMLHSSDIKPDARRFMVDSLRFTPVATRLPFQFLGGTLAGTPLGIRLLSRPMLRVDPPIPDAGSIVILPGNQRVRLFDFKRGITRVLLKQGFDDACMRREIEVRGSTRKGPFNRINAFDENYTWFEEPIVEGWALPRCPPWQNRRAHEGQAMNLLGRWLSSTASAVPAESYIPKVAENIDSLLQRILVKHSPLVAENVRHDVDALSKVACELGVVDLANTHGDFQAGNILVSRSDQRVLLTDWEFSGTRFRYFDAFCYGLRARSRTDLLSSVESFLQTGSLGPATDLLPSSAERSWRGAAVAAFLLEELQYRLEAQVSGRFRQISGSLNILLSRLGALSRLVSH